MYNILRLYTGQGHMVNPRTPDKGIAVGNGQPYELETRRIC